jgi:hypothetical protein
MGLRRLGRRNHFGTLLLPHELPDLVGVSPASFDDSLGPKEMPKSS